MRRSTFYKLLSELRLPICSTSTRHDVAQHHLVHLHLNFTPPTTQPNTIPARAFSATHNNKASIMAGDSFYCLICGTGCPVACYPTHCHAFACHNTSCSAHSHVFPKNHEERALPKLLEWSDETPGNNSGTETTQLGQYGGTLTGLDQMLNNLSLNQAQASDAYSSYLLSNATTTRPKGNRRTRNFDQDPDSTQLQSPGASKPEPSISEIEPGLFIGDKHCVSASFLQEMGITAVITVRRSPISDHPDSRLRKTIPLKDRLFLNAEDAQWQDLAQYFPGACDFIDRRLVGDPLSCET